MVAMLIQLWTEGCSWLMSTRRKFKWTKGTQAGQGTGNLSCPETRVHRHIRDQAVALDLRAVD